MIALRPDHHVDDRRPGDDLAAFGLRHATRHRDAHFSATARGLFLEDAQPSEFGVDFFGSLFADVAGVEDDEVGVIRVGGLDKAFVGQSVHHALCIVDIHLTTIRLDMQFALQLHGTGLLAEMAPTGAKLKYRLKPRKSSANGAKTVADLSAAAL